LGALLFICDNVVQQHLPIASRQSLACVRSLYQQQLHCVCALLLPVAGLVPMKSYYKMATLQSVH
jgi:hypothetical protein